jgi:hypothetical protein
LRYGTKFLPALLLTAFYLFLPAVKSEAAVDIVNELTSGHVKSPGTNAFFIPPEGLLFSERFDGFDSKERDIYVVVADLKIPYSEVKVGFTDSALLTRNVEVGSRGSLTINGANAMLFKALHTDGGKNWGKWILLLEDGDNTLVANGVFTSGDSAAAKDVETMLKSVVIKRDEPEMAIAAVSRDSDTSTDEREAGVYEDEDGDVENRD